MTRTICALLQLTILSTVNAAETKLAEILPAGAVAGVEINVSLEGVMTVPGPPAKTMTVNGSSQLSYDERTLASDEKDVDKLLRIYRKLAISRTVNDKPQKADIRPAVRRMVVLRNEKAKSPFSPDGPLTWAEIDVVKNDLFAPVLARGLLAGKAVNPGESWTASADAVRELTDLEKISEGSITVKFVGIVNFNNKDRARLQISGSVKGVDDNGPAKHILEGTAYFDLDTSLLSYLTIKGTHELLDGDGKTAGRIDGRFIMTRTLKTVEDLSDKAIEKLELSPNAVNSRLLYDNPDLGLQLVHPRRWHVGIVQGKQLTLVGPNRAGILITMETKETLPTANAFLRETLDFLAKDKAMTSNVDQPKRVRNEAVKLDRFGLDAEIGKDSVRLEYAVLSKAAGGATVAARLPKADAEELLKDLDAVLESVKLTK